VDLHGLFPPIPTPFSDSGALDYDALRANLDRWAAQPLSGYVVGGSNGEFVSLSFEERVEVVRAVREDVPSDRLVIAGAGLLGTAETIRLCHEVESVGADAVLIITPHYYRAQMKSQALIEHFTQVADAIDLPLVIYNVPANTGIDLDPGTVIKLSGHENIIGIKDSSGNVTKIGSIVHGAASGFQVLAGSGGFFLGALSVGAVGAVAALANLAATELWEVFEAFRSGDWERARRIQLGLIEINTAVTARYGVPGLKVALDMLGYYGGPVRPPLLSLVEDERSELQAILERAGLLS
jgi:4-hydroxy-2-oxoglutarate aldolase